MPFHIERGVLNRYTEEPGVTEITVPAGVICIASGAFRGCIGLTEIQLPESVTEIGAEAFAECTGLKRMLFPDSVTELQSGVLRDCTALMQCRLPAGIRELPDHMFMGCTALTDAALPESLETVGDYAFFECKSLPRAVLPQRVKAVGDHAFSHCERLTEFTVPVQCAAFGLYVLTWCDRIRVIRLHPDDPALYRDYSTVRRLDADLFSVLCMIRQHDYDKPADVTVKYPLLILHALRTQEPELNAYIRKHCTEMMAECIPAGDVCFVRALAQSADYFTAQNIDGLIALAQESDQQEIVMILLNYKNAHFGFGQTGARRL